MRKGGEFSPLFLYNPLASLSFSFRISMNLVYYFSLTRNYAGTWSSILHPGQDGWRVVNHFKPPE